MSQNYFYKDFEGEELGPFSYAEMRGWWDGNYFDPELLIRKEGETEFTPISDHPEDFPPLENNKTINTETATQENIEHDKEKEHEDTSLPLPPPPPPDSEEEEDDDDDDAPPPPPPPTKKLCEEKVPEDYYYKDNEGKIQGPFQLEQMKAWTYAGFFPHGHLVAAGADSEFLPIEQHPALLSAFPENAEQDAQTVAEISNFQAQQMNAFNFYQQYQQQRVAKEEQWLRQRVAELGGTPDQQYLAIAKFNSLTGVFQKNYSGPFNDADRELSEYLDLDKYQESRREHQRLVELGLANTRKPRKPKDQKK